MSTTTIRPANREEWLEYRKNGIGSSEVATILGVNKWETPYQLWLRKTGKDAPKEETFAMRAGHYLEDAVAHFWHDATGYDIIKASAPDWLIASNDNPFMQVSPDRTYWLSGSRKNCDKGILECKTTQMTIDPDNVPLHWYVQLQYQLGVAELKRGSLAWLCSGRSFDYKEYDFNADFFSWLKEEVTRYWTDNIQGGKEPELTTVEDVITKYNAHTDGKVVEVGEDIYTAYNDLKDLREEIAKLDERKADLESKLKLAFGDAEAISHNGDTLATWKASKPSKKFDEKAFKADHPELITPYIREKQGSRRFLLM